MARSTLDTVVYSIILVAPLATALVYIADARVPAPLAHTIADCPTPIDVAMPIPAVIADATPTTSMIAEPAPPTDEPVPPASIDPPIVGAGLLMFDHRLVISSQPDPAWGKGSLRSHANEYGITVSKSAATSRLPAHLAGTTGHSFTVFAADGSSCLTDAGPLSIYARVDGDIMLYADPELAADAPAEGDPSPAQADKLRREVYADYAALMLARTSRRCDGLWARRTDLPAPAVFGARDLTAEVTDSLADEVAPLLATLPAVATLRASYTAWYDGVDADYRATLSAWPAFYRASLAVRRWDEVGGPRSYLTVDVGTVGEACSDAFAEHASFVLERHGETWTLLEDPGFWSPQALMDLDRDGHLEAVTAGGTAMHTRGADLGVAQSFAIPWWGCPC